MTCSLLLVLTKQRIDRHNAQISLLQYITSTATEITYNGENLNKASLGSMSIIVAMVLNLLLHSGKTNVTFRRTDISVLHT